MAETPRRPRIWSPATAPASERPVSEPSNARPADLESELGKPRADWSANDLVRLVKKREIRLVSLMHVGGDGWLKALDFVPADEEHLRDILDGGERADGSSLFPGGGVPTHASDIVLQPRLESAFVDPFATLPTLVLLCSHRGRDGLPLPESPDTIVRRADARLQGELGCALWAHGEVEYFLGKRAEESDIYGADDRGYHATAPFVFGQELRRRALSILHDLGVPVKYGHSEVGYVEAGQAEGVIWEQHEIELRLMPLPAAADAVLLTQWVLRNLAHVNGMRSSTAPMMLAGHAGNGLHFHFSPAVEGEPVGVRNGDGTLSPAAKRLIGGLVRTGAALMAFGNREPGSFQRLFQGKEAPSRIVWGEFDRSALIRLPVVPRGRDGQPAATSTVEFRLPDGSALPHLLLAGVSQAAALGWEDGTLEALLQRTEVSSTDADSGPADRVPDSPVEVAGFLQAQREVLLAGDVFPARLLDLLISRLGETRD